MDLIKTGKFIAELRKEKGLTQEQLGEKVGVTNKTVSRWETGTYLPPADVLVIMSEFFDVSINELLAGKRLSQEEYKQVAEENLKQVIKTSSFSLDDKIVFYKKKWLKEHITILLLLGLCILAVFLTGLLLSKVVVIYISFVLSLLAHVWRNNTMMTYVEKSAFDGTKDEQ